MKKNIIIRVFIFYFLFISNGIATKLNYFDQGVKLYIENKFEESQILFEKDIVFNPKHEMSYLYLAKIHNNNSNDGEHEINLNNVLLLNPQNDEAIYMLTLLKIELSDYNEAKGLIEKFNSVCKSFCSKKSEIQNKFDKLIPKNEKDNN